MYNAIRGKNKEIKDPIKCDVMHKNKTHPRYFKFGCFGFERWDFVSEERVFSDDLDVPLKVPGVSFCQATTFRPRSLCEALNFHRLLASFLDEYPTRCYDC